MRGEHAVVEAHVVEDAVEFVRGRDADEELVGPASDGVIGIWLRAFVFPDAATAGEARQLIRGRG